MKRQRLEAADETVALAQAAAEGAPADQSGAHNGPSRLESTVGPGRALVSHEGKPVNPPMTAVEAVALAEAEGLTLARSDNRSGFRNVLDTGLDRARPYHAGVSRDGKHVHLGCFATAEEAALHVARTPEEADRAALALSLIHI